MRKPDRSIRPSRSGHLLDSDTWDALLAAGVPRAELEADQPFGPVIFAYTRRQAIEDGVLVDVTELARREGFTIPVAVTDGVMAELTALIRRAKPEDFEAHPLFKVQAAAVRAMLSCLHGVIATAPTASDRLDFRIVDVKLWAHVGPGDEGEPVLTLMLEGED